MPSSGFTIWIALGCAALTLANAYEDSYYFMDNAYYQDAQNGQDTGYGYYYPADSYYFDANDYYVDANDSPHPACATEETGAATVEVCDVRVSGGDAALTGLEGGFDGDYQFVGCQNGHPKYVRQARDGLGAEDERVLSFDRVFQDWNIVPDVAMEDSVVVFGGEGESQPELVQKWSMITVWAAGAPNNGDVVDLPLHVVCINGSAKAIAAVPMEQAIDAQVQDKFESTYEGSTSSSGGGKSTLLTVVLALAVAVAVGLVGSLVVLALVLLRRRSFVKKQRVAPQGPSQAVRMSPLLDEELGSQPHAKAQHAAATPLMPHDGNSLI